jgi:hypothetical protein
MFDPSFPMLGNWAARKIQIIGKKYGKPNIER